MVQQTVVYKTRFWDITLSTAPCVQGLYTSDLATFTDRGCEAKYCRVVVSRGFWAGLGLKVWLMCLGRPWILSAYPA